MDLTTIVYEANLLVPNDVSADDKIQWLNAINQDFFNVVKIPRITPFTPVKDQVNYTLPDEVRLKNIDLVMCGIIKYKELTPQTPNPMQNTFAYDDSTHVLTLRPAPYQAGLQGVVRYSRIATTNFISSNLNVDPDAPFEYHWTFIPALASFIANSQDDAVKASNYENQYKAAWNVAAQNYAKGVTA